MVCVKASLEWQMKTAIVSLGWAGATLQAFDHPGHWCSAGGGDGRFHDRRFHERTSTNLCFAVLSAACFVVSLSHEEEESCEVGENDGNPDCKQGKDCRDP